MKQLTGIALGFVLSIPVLAGDVYQWRDERGQLHFADRPPAAAQAGPVITAPAVEGDAAPEGGLRPGERARLREIDQRESREAAAKQARDKRAAAAARRRERQHAQDAERCTDYRRKIREYKRRLRAGCRISKCSAYEAQIESYRSRAAQVCH